MSLEMCLEVSVFCEALTTEMAFVWLHTTVGSLMDCKAFLSLVLLSTNRAFVWLLTSVYSEVSFQVALGDESLAAPLIVAFKRSEPSVCPQMNIEISRDTKVTQTIAVGAKHILDYVTLALHLFLKSSM
jgi:hypothetical protein